MAALHAEIPAQTKQERLLFLDWLRVLAVLGVFYFHTLRPFDSLADWNIKNPERSLVANIMIGFFYQWGMPLFFPLAGTASWFALRSRSGHQFLRERALRLLLPLIIGFLLFGPPQAYVEALTHGNFQGSFLQFYPWFFAHIRLSWHAPWINFNYHLWFLIFLWVFTLLTLPLFLFLRRASGQRIIDTLAAWCAKPSRIFLFIIPIALIQMALRAAFPLEHDWADLIYYLAFFLCGYLLFSRPAFAEAIRKYGWPALGIGIICSLSMAALLLSGYGLAWERSPSYTVGSLLYQVLRSINTWSWLIFVFFCGMRWFTGNNRFLRYMNEAVLPFYVLQHPVIILVAFYVVPLNIGILPKWLIMSALAFILVMALYELLVRRINSIRWLFGMKRHYGPSQEEMNASIPLSTSHMGRSKV